MSEAPKLPENFHLGVIMDGNGRWGKARRGLTRLDGHEAGVKRIDELFRVAQNHGVKFVSLFAFSTENWSRSETEINGLMKIFRRFIADRGDELVAENVRVRFIGDKSAFSKDLVKSMDALEAKSQTNDGLQAFVAMNYGGHDEILRTARKLAVAGLDFTKENFEAHLDTAGAPPVDLLIRTSGEERISNFLIWQCAYAEFYFTQTLWPDFGEAELIGALEEFTRRHRRFGREE